MEDILIRIIFWKICRQIDLIWLAFPREFYILFYFGHLGFLTVFWLRGKYQLVFLKNSHWNFTWNVKYFHHILGHFGWNFHEVNDYLHQLCVRKVFEKIWRKTKLLDISSSPIFNEHSPRRRHIWIRAHVFKNLKLMNRRCT